MSNVENSRWRTVGRGILLLAAYGIATLWLLVDSIIGYFSLFAMDGCDSRDCEKAIEIGWSVINAASILAVALLVVAMVLALRFRSLWRRVGVVLAVPATHMMFVLVVMALSAP